MITSETVRKARPSDAASISQALAAAFYDSSLLRFILPDDDHRVTAIREFFDLIVDIMAVHDDTWTTPDGTAGAALWVPYGHEPMSAEMSERFATELAKLAGPYADRTLELFELADKHHPHEPHEYLFFLGVQPENQNRGIGTALMAPVLARADAAGHPCYLETSDPRNRTLYERHGFRAIAEITPPSGPQFWPMVRNPQ